MTNIKTNFGNFFKALPSKALGFCKRHINAFYIAITVILLLLLMSCVITRPDVEVKNQLTLEPGLGTPPLGFDAHINSDGHLVLDPTSDDKSFLFLFPEHDAEINKIVLRFNTKVTCNSFPVYFSYEGEELNSEQVVIGFVSSDGHSATIDLESAKYDFFRIDIHEAYVLEEAYFEHCLLKGFLRYANIVTIIILIASLAVLAILEFKFRYFRAVFALAKRIYSSTVELLRAKKYVHFVVRLLMILSLITLCVSIFIFLMLVTVSLGVLVYLFVLSFLSVAFFLADRIMCGRIHSPLLFLVIAIIFGVMLSFCLPTFLYNSWDEAYHFDRCVDLKMMFFPTAKTLADTHHNLGDGDVYLKNIDGAILDISLLDMAESPNPNKTVSLYKSLAYFPASIVMFISDLLAFNIFTMLVLAKIVNVLTYAFVIYSGIKRLKSGKLIFSSICLLPTAIFIASAFSYDYFITAFVAYAYAYFISELQQPDKHFTLKDGVLMLGAMLLACGPKAIYFALIVPMLFIGSHKFETKKAHKIYKIACIVVMAIAILSFIVPFITNTDASSDLRGGSDVNALEQVKFILKNPFEYFGILIKFIGNYVSLQFSAENSAFYAYIGLPQSIFGTVSIFLIAFCTFLDKGECDLFPKRKRLKGLTLFIVFAQIALVATALYVSFTPVAHTTVNGCQWRYIIPILIPFSYCIGSSKIKHTIDEKFFNGVVYGALALNLFASIYDVYFSKAIELLSA